MESVAGLDVGVKKSALCVVTRDASSTRLLRRHRTATDPSSIGSWLASQGVVRVGLEAGAQSSWLAHELEHRGFEVTVIPHTLAATSLGTLAAGAAVNLEVDVVARYVARLAGFAARGAAPESTAEPRDAEWVARLSRAGYV